MKTKSKRLPLEKRSVSKPVPRSRSAEMRDTRYAMAFDRQTFKNRLGEYLSGALHEFYKAQLATKNNLTRWVEHWRTEVRRLLDSSRRTWQAEIRGFKDRAKAAREVVAYLRTRDSHYRTLATNDVLRDFQVSRLKASLDDTDTQAFWTYAATITEAAQ